MIGGNVERVVVFVNSHETGHAITPVPVFIASP